VTWTIRVLNWGDFQHYKDRDPPWIKLHQRRLFEKPAWRRLHGSAAKLLVDVWMLTAALGREGSLEMTLTDLAYRVRIPEPDVLEDLQVLEAFQFLELAPDLQAKDSKGKQKITNGLPEVETETEGERETETPRAKRASPEVVGNWVTEFGVAWKARFAGTVSYKRIGHALKPLRETYSDAEILSRWERYLSKVQGQYASAEDFAKKFSEWAPQIAPVDTRVTKDVAIRRAIDVLRIVDPKRIPHDGFPSVVAFELWLGQERERQEDDAA
jgi:hypothetical protein